MVTFVLQNLRTIAPDFDDWYGPKQEEMRADPLMRYFHDLRTEIEKQAGSSYTIVQHRRHSPISTGAAGRSRFLHWRPKRGLWVAD